MTTRRNAFLILLIIAVSAYGQYFDERVLEKSFEIEDFFFQPSYLNPYGLEGFGSAAMGLIDDLLLNLQLNPAFPTADLRKNHYFYINFRNQRVLEDNSGVYPVYDAGEIRSADYGISYPWYYVQTRKVLEPIFSAAYFIRPLKQRSLVLGMSYQILLQEEDFYEIPQDIYRNQPGLDFEGNDMTGPSNMPVIDLYSAENNMYHEGHFLSLYSSFRLTSRMDFGLRLSTVLFNRDGSVGSTYTWDNDYSPGRQDRNIYLNERSQDYDHLDGCLGINWLVTDHAILGITAGYLNGNAVQSLDQSYDYETSYGDAGTDEYWSYYYSQGAADQGWKHKGGGLYGGLNLMLFSNPSRSLNFYYQIRHEKLDIDLNSEVEDTSMSDYYSEWTNGATTQYYSGNYHSRVSDLRDGSGQKEGFYHKFGAALQYKIDPKTKLNIGAQVQIKKTSTRTSEDVISDRNWFNHYDSDGTTSDYSYAIHEDKTLDWDFESDLMRFQIPVFLFYKISPRFELMFGVNRDMQRWLISDETLASVRTRITEENGATKTETNFAERIRLPEERRSEVTTTVLGGLTIAPSDHFNVRFLFSPQFTSFNGDTDVTDFQFWIDFNVLFE